MDIHDKLAEVISDHIGETQTENLITIAIAAPEYREIAYSKPGSTDNKEIIGMLRCIISRLEAM